MDAYGGPLLPGRVSAAILRPCLKRLAMREMNDHLDGRADVEDALDHTRDPVVASGSVVREVDPFRTDDELDPSCGAEVAAGGRELEVAKAHFSFAVSDCRHHVRHPEEIGYVGGGGLFVDGYGAADLLDLAVRHHGQAVGHGERLLLVVGDVYECDAHFLLQRLQLDLKGLAQLGVEGAEGLVKQKHGRVKDEGS